MVNTQHNIRTRALALSLCKALLVCAPVLTRTMILVSHTPVRSLASPAWYENCSKVAELRSVAFMICFFHAIILERKKFGPQGWNVKYDFNTGDLNGSCLVAVNYLENNTKIPWADLRYITGEIMYGGHITNNFDRRLVDAYLNTYLNPELLDGFTIFPGFGEAFEVIVIVIGLTFTNLTALACSASDSKQLRQLQAVPRVH
jgi:hypothetical protein